MQRGLKHSFYKEVLQHLLSFAWPSSHSAVFSSWVYSYDTRLKYCPCGHVETPDFTSMMKNEASLLIKYLLLLSFHLVVYMTKMQVVMNSCMRATGPGVLQD